MKTLIIGPNSQVGFSVLFYLTHYYGIDAVGYHRNNKYSTFFDSMDLKYQNYLSCDKKKLSFFKNFDLIIDFIYPSCDFEDVENVYRKHIREIIPFIPKSARYISISSIMASPFDITKSNGIPKTVYGFLKFKCERIILKNKLNNINVIRLGEVHGFLQAIDMKYLESFRFNNIINVNDDVENANVLFISDLCDYIIQSDTINGILINNKISIFNLLEYYKSKYSYFGEVSTVHPKAPAFKEKIILILLKMAPKLMKKIRVYYRSKSYSKHIDFEIPYFHFYNLHSKSINFDFKGVEQIRSIEEAMIDKYNKLKEKCII
jgi:hypothetical protein